jgi:AcrR family transcriptional regulator
MVKPGVAAGTRTERTGTRTRERIVRAALDTLRKKGFAGASARAIARRGRFNQALIFYHFGGLHPLLLAALDQTSARRIERYREATRDVQDLPELLRVAASLYEEDLASGHITVLTEMVSAASAAPELRRELAARVEPWIVFAQETVERVIGGSSLERMVPTRDLAFGVVAGYLGLEMLTHLQGDRAPAGRLFATATGAASMLGILLGAQGGEPG